MTGVQTCALPISAGRGGDGLDDPLVPVGRQEGGDTGVERVADGRQSDRGQQRPQFERFNLTGDQYGNPADEGRIITAEFDDFWVVTCYTPNSKGDLSRLNLRHEQWDPAVLAYLEELELVKPVLYCGDMNVAHQEIDLANPKANVGKHS